jgi:translation initiation factor IF-3
VPIPRRFDRRPPERDPTRINERIRVPEVRLIDETGAQVGVVKVEDALERARDKDLDLVEIAAEAKPPVCRILDYSKYKYEQEQRRKAARKHQQQVTIREMKLRPKIATHDYETKKGHVLRFLKQGFKVKVTIMFRGREVTHPERGESLLRKLATEIAEFGTIEQQPNQEGRNMTMMVGPVRGGKGAERPKEPDTAAGVTDGAAVADGAAAAPEAPAVAADSEPAAAPASEPAASPDSEAPAAAPNSAAPAPAEEPASAEADKAQGTAAAEGTGS